MKLENLNILLTCLPDGLLLMHVKTNESSFRVGLFIRFHFRLLYLLRFKTDGAMIKEIGLMLSEHLSV